MAELWGCVIFPDSCVDLGWFGRIIHPIKISKPATTSTSENSAGTCPGERQLNCKSLLASAFVILVWSLVYEATVCLFVSFVYSPSPFGVLQGAAYHFEVVPQASHCGFYECHVTCISIQIILNSKFGNSVLAFSGCSNRKEKQMGTRSVLRVLGDTKAKDDR